MRFAGQRIGANARSSAPTLKRARAEIDLADRLESMSPGERGRYYLTLDADWRQAARHIYPELGKR